MAYIVLYFIVTYTMGMPQLKNTTDIWCTCNEATIQVLVCTKKAITATQNALKNMILQLMSEIRNSYKTYIPAC